ncbi:hypothetical protein D3C81_602240 [compost metagenome]
MQHRSHFPGADAFGAGQAGAVLHHQMWRGDAFLRQPLAHYALGSLGVIAIGVGAEFLPQAQEQLLGHGVVTVLVDVADDFREVRRERPCQHLGVFRRWRQHILALNAATQLFPDRTNGASGVGRVVEQRQVSLRAAAFTQLTADRHGHAAIGLRHRVVAHATGALLGVEGLDLVVDADARNRRLHRDQHLARVIARDEAQRLEVDQQRVGLDQERLVIVVAVVIELRQLRLHEEGFIQHQVAGDLGHAVGAQVAHQQPEFFHVQLRITATLEVEVAVEDAAAEGAIGVELGFPLVIGAEHFQGRVRSDQLHGRRRVDRDVGVEDGRGAGAVEWNHHQRQGVVLQLAGLEGFFNVGRQSGVDRFSGNGEGQRQKKAGQQQWTQRFDHVK